MVDKYILTRAFANKKSRSSSMESWLEFVQQPQAGPSPCISRIFEWRASKSPDDNQFNISCLFFANKISTRRMRNHRDHLNKCSFFFQSLASFFCLFDFRLWRLLERQPLVDALALPFHFHKQFAKCSD